jgi:uncharacterized membrane protein (DUF2068 family)
MNRPGGVTVIAILDFIGAALCLLMGILSVVGAGAGIMGAMGQGGQGAAAGGGVLAVIAGFITVFAFVGAAISALLGWGLWKLKNWARLITIVFAVIGALFQLFGLFGVLAHFNVFALIMTLIPLAINGLIAWYLLQKNVAAAFQGAARAAAA